MFFFFQKAVDTIFLPFNEISIKNIEPVHNIKLNQLLPCTDGSNINFTETVFFKEILDFTILCFCICVCPCIFPMYQLVTGFFSHGIF